MRVQHSELNTVVIYIIDIFNSGFSTAFSDHLIVVCYAGIIAVGTIKSEIEQTDYTTLPVTFITYAADTVCILGRTIKVV